MEEENDGFLYSISRILNSPNGKKIIVKGTNIYILDNDE